MAPIFNMQYKKYIKKSWLLAWPIMLANLATPALAMADTFILGHLDNISFLAALSIGTGIFAYVLWGFNCISLSCSTFTGSANASNDRLLVTNRLYQFSLIAIIISIILFLMFQTLIEPILTFIRTPKNIQPHVLIYLKIMSFGILPLLFIQTSIAWFTGLKQPKIALYVLLIASAANIILGLYFVFILKMNINGVALASVFAHYITAFFVILFIINYQKGRQLTVKVDRSIWLDTQKLFSFGGALLIRSGVLLSVFLVFNLKSASINEVTAAANVLLLTILILISSALDATASSAQVQISNTPKHSNTILFSTFLLMVMFVTMFILIISLFGKNYIEWISNQTNVQLTAITYLPWMILLCITSSTSYWLDGVFLGWQKSHWMRNSVLISGAIAFFPWVLGFDLNNHQLWLSLNAFMLMRSLCMWVYFFKYTFR